MHLYKNFTLKQLKLLQHVLICDFSKEQYGSLKMILGSKHVRAILCVLALNFYVGALDGIIKMVLTTCYIDMFWLKGKDCFTNVPVFRGGSGSPVGIVSELRAGWSGDRIPVKTIFSARPDRPWAPPSLL